MEENVTPVPLKDVFRRDLLAMLKDRKDSGTLEEKTDESSSL
jgi:hypothetical protein